MGLSLTTLVALFGTVLGSSVVAQLISGLLQRRKTSAEAETMVADQILKWANALTKRIEQLEAEIHMKNTVIAELQVRIAKLEIQECELERRELALEKSLFEEGG